MTSQRKQTSSRGLRNLAGSWVLKTQRALTALGQRLNWEWLIYNRLVHMGFERAARRNAPPLALAIRLQFPTLNRIVDIGCGTGGFMQHFKQQGFQVTGVEYSAALRSRCSTRGLDVYPFDVSQKTPPPPGAPFDLALSTEVAEHIPEEFADPLVEYICGLASTIVFTAALPGQGGTGHVNEQPREYWIAKFAARGFLLDEPSTTAIHDSLKNSPAFSFMYQNLSVFVQRRQG